MIAFASEKDTFHVAEVMAMGEHSNTEIVNDIKNGRMCFAGSVSIGERERKE